MKIRVDIFNKEQYDSDDWPPENAAEFVSWFNEKLSNVPDEFSHLAIVDLEAIPSYENSAYASIQIYYYRPETEKEIYDREITERNKQNMIKQKELRQLAELQKKYT